MEARVKICNLSAEVKRILLVAKPWRGGLANYVYTALNKLFPEKVEWIPTRPISTTEKIKYRIDKQKWKDRLIEKIGSKERDFAFFINQLPGFSNLGFHSGNVLWITDRPILKLADYAPYAKVYLSDPGYLEDVSGILPGHCLGGELGFAFCPNIHHWDESRSEERELCFIGNMDPKRDPYIEALLSSDISFSVIGNYFLKHPFFWRKPLHFSPSINYKKMGQIYAKHKLSLNLHAKVVRQGTNMRTFECAGYGIPQLVEYRPGIEKYFEPEREILTFSETSEMLEKGRQLLADQEYRRQMAERAISRARAEHSYVHRLLTVLNDL